MRKLKNLVVGAVCAAIAGVGFAIQLWRDMRKGGE
jgi:hypothetical protein